MASAVEDMFQEATESILATDAALARRVIARDEEIDQEEVAVESETIRLMALFQPMASDMRLLCTVLKVNNDLERIADCTVNICERVLHLEPAIDMSAHLPGLREMLPAVRSVLRGAVQAYAQGDAEGAREVVGKDAVVDALYGQFIRRLVVEAPKSPGVMAMHLDVMSIAKNLERIADHATNIAEDVIFMSTGRIVRHRDE